MFWPRKLYGPLRPLWQPRVPFRFDPTTPAGRRALAVAVIIWRHVADEEPIPGWLEKSWIATATAAAFEGRARAHTYSSGSGGVGETERLATVTEGCMRLAAAFVSWERSGSVTG